MNKLKQLSVGKRVVFMFGTLCVILAAIGAWHFFSLRSIERSSQEKLSYVVDESELVAAASQNVGLMQAVISRNILTSDPAEIKLHDQAIHEIDKANAEEIAIYQRFVDTKEEGRLYARVQYARKEYMELTVQLLALGRANRDAEAREFAVSKQVPAYEEYQRAIKDMIGYLENEVRDIAAAMNHRIARIRMVGNASVIIAILIAIGTGVAVTGVARRLKEDNRTLQAEVAERKKAEEMLREAEAKLRMSVSASNIGLWDWNLATNEVYFSREWKSQLGYAEDEIPERLEEWETRLHPDDRDLFFAKVRELVASGGRNYEAEYGLLHKDGTYRWIFSRAELFAGEDGKPTRMVGAHLDITERKRTEAATVQLAAIVRFSDDAILGKGLNGIITSWNRGAERIFGYAAGEIVGSSITRLIPPDRQEEDEQVLGRIGQGESVEHFETVRIGKDGRQIDISLTVSPIKDAAGDVVGASTVARDITRLKRAQGALQQANDDLRVVSRRLFRVRDDERRHLARELHDEIGQALTAAKINVDSIESIEGSKQSLRLKETVTLLDNLLRQVRQISFDLHPSLLDDLGLAPALRSLLDQQAQRTGLRVQFSAVEPLEDIDPGIQTTGFRIAQEAITNVLRHAKAQSVGVHLRIEADQLQMKIVDDGSGFDLGEVERRAQQGAAFGLMGMRERAALVGGRVQIISSPNKGTTVEVFLPLKTSGEISEFTA